MLPVTIADGLYRWTAPHPEWQGQTTWERNVGCVAYDLGEIVVCIDPQLPGDRDAFWGWLDALVAGRPVSVLTTIRFHARDREAVSERYAANTTRAPNYQPPGVQGRPLRGAGETVFWLPAVATLVPGDSLIGAPGGGVQLCPQEWLDDAHAQVDRRGLAGLLDPLLELPVERVLVSHGEPALSEGRTALASALREAVTTRP